MLKKLVTTHDRWHVHKTLGAACLLSFVYHYTIMWRAHGKLQASKWIILLHVALSCTGLQFQVPLRRIKKFPTMIWEEYRLHAVVFSFRAVAVAWCTGLWRLLAICCVHLAADEVTRRYGEQGSTTVRGRHDHTPSPRLWWLTRSYAVYQHLAIASHLAATDSTAVDLAYNSFIAVQSSAFCMTLHRKNLITWKGHAATYLVCIAVSALFIVHTLPWTHTALALMCSAARMRGVPKYALWFGYWLCVVRYTPSAH